MEDNYIHYSERKDKSDRVIRQVYTPKEIVGLIHKIADTKTHSKNLTYSEKLLLIEAYNELIWWFKDD